MECLLRVHCVTSWGVDVAILSGGSVVSAVLASMATGCGGGMIANLLLDPSSSVWMDKITAVLMKYKKWEFLASFISGSWNICSPCLSCIKC